MSDPQLLDLRWNEALGKEVLCANWVIYGIQMVMDHWVCLEAVYEAITIKQLDCELASLGTSGHKNCTK